MTEKEIDSFITEAVENLQATGIFSEVDKAVQFDSKDVTQTEYATTYAVAGFITGIRYALRNIQ